MRKVLLAFVAALAVAAASAQLAAADPTRHFTESFPIDCGGKTYLLVSKVGSSQVITVDGVPSNSVSVLFRLVLSGPSGSQTLVDKPLPKTAHLTVCTGPGDSPGETITAWTLITPG
jgi:hypothetical protein